MKVETYPVGELQTNCYLLWDEDGTAAVVDPGAEAPRLLRAIKEHGLTVKVILLTHVHFDHIGAVPALQEATGAPLMVCEDDAPALTDATRSLHTMFGYPAQSLHADRLLKDGDTVTVGTLTLTVLHTPGHTPGSCCYVCGDLLFTGDTLFCGSIGRTDFPGGDARAMTASLQKLAALSGDRRVLPGHDAESTLAAEHAQNPFLKRL